MVLGVTPLLCWAWSRWISINLTLFFLLLERMRSAPILLKDHPKNITSTPGKNVTFECIEFISNPMPDYRWYRWHTVPDTYPLLDFHNTSQFTEIDPIHYTPMQVKVHNVNRYGGKLTLENITENDFGLYSCVLRNQFGMDYASAFLHWKPNESKHGCFLIQKLISKKWSYKATGENRLELIGQSSTKQVSDRFPPIVTPDQ